MDGPLLKPKKAVPIQVTTEEQKNRCHAETYLITIAVFIIYLACVKVFKGFVCKIFLN